MRGSVWLLAVVPCLGGCPEDLPPSAELADQLEWADPKLPSVGTPRWTPHEEPDVPDWEDTGGPGWWDVDTDTDTDWADYGTSGDTGECDPFCQPGWTCGYDGCGGKCGPGCPPESTCDFVMHQCVSPHELGDPCGRGEECPPPGDDSQGSAQAFATCLATQCTEGLCLEPACSGYCQMAVDTRNWAGEPVPDGIQDPGSPFDSCSGAADGPMGDQWTCVATLDPAEGVPLDICLPGTLFAPCATNDDCPSGEACQIHFVLGSFVSRCGAVPKEGGDPGDACNWNPQAGPVAYCDDLLCEPFGCSGLCEADEHCASDVQVCGDGQCAPAPCQTNTDCAGGLTHFCQPDAEPAVLGTSGTCHAIPPNPAELGASCWVWGPACAGPCVDGACSAMCTTDADCAPEGRCTWQLVSVGDGLLPRGLCRAYPGSQTECAHDADCEEETCRFYPFLGEDGSPDAGGLCSAQAGDTAMPGACGGPGQVCASGVCAQTPEPFCTSLCTSVSDCPTNAAIGDLSGGFNMVCSASIAGPGPDPAATSDDVLVSTCSPRPAYTNSLQDCALDGACPADQACMPFAIGLGSTGPTKVEHLCAGPFGDAAAGTPCSPEPFSAECAGGHCLPDPEAGGYCSTWCATDSDCAAAGMTCGDLLLLDRKDDANDAITRVCRKL